VGCGNLCRTLVGTTSRSRRSERLWSCLSHSMSCTSRLVLTLRVGCFFGVPQAQVRPLKKRTYLLTSWVIRTREKLKALNATDFESLILPQLVLARL